VIESIDKDSYFSLRTEMISVIFTDARYSAGGTESRPGWRKRPSPIFSIRLIALLALTLSAVLLRAPLALAANSRSIPNMTIDTFTAGGLGNAINTVRGGSPYSETISLSGAAGVAVRRGSQSRDSR
jgi:hypothetical protein